MFAIDCVGPNAVICTARPGDSPGDRDGRLRTGDRLPTVRQLAVDLRINANTVAKVTPSSNAPESSRPTGGRHVRPERAEAWRPRSPTASGSWRRWRMDSSPRRPRLWAFTPRRSDRPFSQLDARTEKREKSNG